jgi:hypothetical protein
MKDELLKYIENKDGEIKNQTIKAIERLRLSEGKAFLVKNLTDKNLEVRLASIYALVSINATDKVSEIRSSLSTLPYGDNTKIFFASDYALRKLGKGKYMESRNSGIHLLLYEENFR